MKPLITKTVVANVRSDYNEWNISVLRHPSHQIVAQLLPRPSDLPDDIRAALLAWLCDDEQA